ncbi:MAG TPA: DinB family protein [Chryseolinea sp.]|nr:DinB family protein [Chryseolinea sp.]
MAYDLIHHLNYNVWANDRIAGVVQSIDEELFRRQNKSSFPSIEKTMVHIWGAQHIWLRRMHGESLSVSPIANGTWSKSEVLAGLNGTSLGLVAFVESKSPSFLATRYAYRNLKGDPFNDPYEDTLYHVVNHSTYHRGQIITMLREGDINTVPATDLIHYLRELKK